VVPARRTVETECGRKRVRVAGLVGLGPSFGPTATLITSAKPLSALSPDAAREHQSGPDRVTPEVWIPVAVPGALWQPCLCTRDVSGCYQEPNFAEAEKTTGAATADVAISVSLLHLWRLAWAFCGQSCVIVVFRSSTASLGPVPVSDHLGRRRHLDGDGLSVRSRLGGGGPGRPVWRCSAICRPMACGQGQGHMTLVPRRHQSIESARDETPTRAGGVCSLMSGECMGSSYAMARCAAGPARRRSARSF